MNPRTIALAAFTFAVVFVAQPVHAQSTGSIHGRVIDQDGKPVAYATIMLDDSAVDVARRDGSYLIANVGEGSHLLRVTMIGFQPVAMAINVTPDVRVEHRVRMTARPIDMPAIVVLPPALPPERAGTWYTLRGAEIERTGRAGNELFRTSLQPR